MTYNDHVNGVEVWRVIQKWSPYAPTRAYSSQKEREYAVRTLGWIPIRRVDNKVEGCLELLNGSYIVKDERD